MPRTPRLLALLAAALALPSAPAAAKDSLGIFDEWGAFRDPQAPRCYAIAKPASSRLRRDFEPFASVGTWPRRNIRGQVHFRLSRKIDSNRPITLVINDRRFALTGSGADAWARDPAMDAAIIAAMRSGARMVVGASGTNGQRFSNSYDLGGAATAMDAATVGCARR